MVQGRTCRTKVVITAARTCRMKAAKQGPGYLGYIYSSMYQRWKDQGIQGEGSPHVLCSAYYNQTAVSSLLVYGYTLHFSLRVYKRNRWRPSSFSTRHSRTLHHREVESGTGWALCRKNTANLSVRLRGYQAEESWSRRRGALSSGATQ